MEFESFGKIERIGKLNPRITITEKLDGTNAQIAFNEHGEMFVGSRNRWLQPEGEGPKGCDNYGFAAWCRDNKNELIKLGPGRHFGEFYGSGIGPRKYGLSDRRLALFNTQRWGTHNPNTPACCEVVTVLFDGIEFDVGTKAKSFVRALEEHGSLHVPGFMDPEGVVVYFAATRSLFKALCGGNGPKKHPSPIEGVTDV